MYFAAVVGAVVVGNAFATKEESFREWENKFQKKYTTASLREKAFSTWKANVAVVASINNEGLKWTASLGKYADLSSTEFQETMLMRHPLDAITFDKTIRGNHTSTSIPTPKRSVATSSDNSLDWREHGAVAPVQDQGSAGTCWTFSTVANIEGQWFLAGNDLTKLSEEYLVDCDSSQDAATGHADCGIFGGWPYLAYDFVIGAKGVPTEEAYPYCAGGGTGSCYPCYAPGTSESLCGPGPYPTSCERHEQECKLPASFDMLGTLSSWIAVSADEAEIAQQLETVGPLSALFDATQLQYYQGGIWDGVREGGNPKLGCSTTMLNHAVLLVGYGTDAASGMDYWLVKNSWGENWGEDGYFRITRGTGACGINTAVTTGLV